MLLEVPDVDPAPTGLPEWVQVGAALGPAVTLLAALIAGAIALATLRQRRVADAKAEWWRRTQWAFDRILEADAAHRDVGTAALARLQASELATSEDLDLLRTGWDAVLQDVPEDAAAYERRGTAVPASGARVRASAAGTTVEVTPAQVRAAGGRLDVDRRLGRDTPEWIRRVAAARPPPPG